MKKILSGLMMFAMVLGMAFGGASKADASGVTSDALSIEFSKQHYYWGVDTYVQQYLSNGATDREYSVVMKPERLINNVWTAVAGAQQTFYVQAGQSYWANSLISANGIYKAKGTYRIKYEIERLYQDRSTWDYQTSAPFYIN